MIRLVEKAEAGEAQTTLTLPYEQRIKSRLRVTLDDGREAGLFLPRGTTMKEGELLAGENGERVRVVAAAETLSIARCDDPHLFARACYHLGNRHVPLQIGEGMLAYLHDHVLDDLLRGLGVEVAVEQAPFEPEPGAYGGSAGGHHHH
ncbi:urease accessory protein UreE [Endothiovibrio diazotrophicus]